MTTLLLFAFASGLVTIFAPCIWPLLPIVLSSSSTGGKKKPLGLTLGIITSFSFFTLAISYLVKLFHLDPDILRLLAVIMIGFLGLTLVVPSLSQRLEGVLSRFSIYFGGGIKSSGNGFMGGLITGFSLGIVWSPCAGPILATIALLAATRAVSFEAVLVTIAYVIGVGIPLFLFSSGAKWIFAKSRLVSRYTGRTQQVFGVIMILAAFGIYTNYDKVVEAKLLEVVPSYSGFLNKLEGNEAVQIQLDLLKGKKANMGKEFSTKP
jgi:cytochrome c biogenesis protein CcdA